MNKNLLLKIIFIFSLLNLMNSCTYEHDEDYFNNIEKPTSTNNSIILREFKELDTINLESKMIYDFKRKDSQNIIETSVFLNKEEIGSQWSNGIGEFILYPERYSDGVHEIEIKHIFNSGSGSIADQVGLETIEKIEVFKFVVARKPPIPPTIEAKIEEGTIFVKWNKPIDLNFDKAYLNIEFKRFTEKVELTKEQLLMGRYNDVNTILFEGNWNSLYYDDFSNVNYFIEYENKYETSISNSTSLSYDFSFNVELELVNFSKMRVIWSSHSLYKNFDFFEIGATNPFLGASTGGEKIIDIDFSFGNKYGMTTRVSKEVFNRTIPPFNFRDLDISGDYAGKFDFEHLFSKNIIYNPKTSEYGSLIIENRTNEGYELYLYIFDEIDLTLKNKKFILETKTHTNLNRLKLNLDPSNNHYIIDTGYSTYFIDNITFNTSSRFPILEEPFSDVIVRNDIIKKWDYMTDKLELFNNSNEELIFEASSSNAGIISNDGNYFLIQKNGSGFVYKINPDNSIDLVIDNLSNDYTNPTGYIFYKNLLFYNSVQNIHILNLDTLKDQTIAFGAAGQQGIQYDPISNKLVMNQSESVAIYDLETNEIVRFNAQDDKFSNKKFSEDRDYYLSLQNGRLIYSQGLFIDNF